MALLNNVSYRPLGIDFTRQNPEVSQLKQRNEESRIAQAEEKTNERYRKESELTSTALGRYIDVKA